MRARPSTSPALVAAAPALSCRAVVAGARVPTRSSRASTGTRAPCVASSSTRRSPTCSPRGQASRTSSSRT
eukprot:scaffold92378_cov57-Phaeocystis_antarctica.AAC.2